MLRNANRTVQGNIIRAFVYSPVNGMGYAVAWTIENALRSKSGRISIRVDNVAPNSKNGYTVTFAVNDGAISSEWVNEYGIWRISAFGDFAAGDKTLVEKRDQADRDAQRLKTDYDFQLSAGLAFPLEVGPAFGADIKFRTRYSGSGMRIYTAGEEFFQIDASTGVYIPVRIKKIGLTPYADIGLGLAFKKAEKKQDSYYADSAPDIDVGYILSFQGGLLFTTVAVPGMFFQAVYQHNFYAGDFEGVKPSILFFGIGYGF
jgi:hypothetical protein